MNLPLNQNTNQNTNPSLDNPSPHNDESTSSLSFSWKSLLSYFSPSKRINLPQLNTISSIIYKLGAAHKQTKSLELQSRQLLLKEELLKIKKDQLIHSPNPSQSLSLDTIKKIEHELNIL